MVFKDYKMKGYTLHTIKTDKFKMCHVEVIFRNNVVKEEITKRNLLFDMLCECSKSTIYCRKISKKSKTNK